VKRTAANHTKMYPFHQYGFVQWLFSSTNKPIDGPEPLSLEYIYQYDIGVWIMCVDVPESTDPRTLKAHIQGFANSGSFLQNQAGNIVVGCARNYGYNETNVNVAKHYNSSGVYQGILMTFFISRLTANSPGPIDMTLDGSYVDITVFA
jgi:hypothetical protein